MPSDKNKKLLNPKWEQESDKIRKVQISLDFPETEDVLIRTLAAREHQAPSALVREILGLETSPPKRARIGVSFNDKELEALAERYGVQASNKAEIRRKVTEEVTAVLSSAGESDAKLSGLSDSNHASDNADLQRVSDDIYQRFQTTLANRTNKK